MSLLIRASQFLRGNVLYLKRSIRSIFQLNPNCANGWNPVIGQGVAAFTRATSANFVAICAADLLLNATYFDGSTYAEIPATTYKKATVQFTWESTEQIYSYLITPVLDTTGVVYVSNVGVLGFDGYTSVLIDGVAAANGVTTLLEGKNYTVEVISSSDNTLATLGVRYQQDFYFWKGLIANLKLYTNAADTIPAHWYKMNTLEMVDSMNPDDEQPNLLPSGFSDWAFDSGFTVDGSRLISEHRVGRGYRSIPELEGSNSVGKLYQLSYDILEYTSGNIVFSLYGDDAPNITNVGSVQVLLNPVDGNTTNIYLSNGGYMGNFILDNISVKQTFTGEYTGTPVIQSLDVGTIRTADIDEPIIELEGGLLEGEATNYVTQSQNIISSNWSKSFVNVGVDDSVITPDGGVAFLVTVDNTVGSRHGVFNSTTAGAGHHTHSVYVKARESNNAYVVLHYSYTRDIYHRIVFDTVNGVVTQSKTVGGIVATSRVEETAGGWYRLSITADLSPDYFTVSASDTASYAVDMDYGYKRFAGDGLLGFYIWQPQTENVAFPTSPIYTEGAPVTRAASNLTYDAMGNFNPTLFSIECEFSLLGLNAGTQYLWSVSDGSTTNHVRIVAITDGRVLFSVKYNGVEFAVASTTLVSSSTNIKATMVFNGTEMSSYLDGEVLTPISVTETPNTPLTRMDVGQGFWGGDNMNGHIKSLKIYDYDITNPDAFYISSLFKNGEDGAWFNMSKD